MQKRNYHRIEKNADGSYGIQTVEIDSFDVFEFPLETIVTDVKNLANMSEILSLLGFVADNEYFFHQCKDVISVPEKHINNKGQGKFAFQAYFQNFPDSVISINNDAIVVVVLQPLMFNADGKRNFNVVGYIHVNVLKVKHEGEYIDGYYYNLLRISERVENNIKVYRRKKIFTLMFSIMHSIVDSERNIAFTYGAMGKENQAINEALELNTKLYKKHYEKFAFTNNTQINKLFGSKEAFKKCVDITNDRSLLKLFYQKLKTQKEDYTFFHFHTEGQFLGILDNIFAYSKSSRVYMVPDKDGNMDAVGLAINWGDYMNVQLENPQGFFKTLAKLELTDKVLYPIMLVGSTKGVDVLLRGMASHYNKTYNCKVTTINSYNGDPYYKTKKSLLSDDYLFLIITNDVDKLNEIKEKSRDKDGNIRLFIDVPLL
jgi:hypothetical protein